MLNFSNSKQTNLKGESSVDALATYCQESPSFVLACDERCPVVRSLATILSVWDRKQVFTFVDRNSNNKQATSLTTELDRSPWSLLLADGTQRWFGPEAIPIILTHLPFGKAAAVVYILPGTMWLTRQLYELVSRHRHRFSTANKTAEV